MTDDIQLFATSSAKAGEIFTVSTERPVIRFTVLGYPVPQGRPRFSTRGGFPRAYDPENSRDWKRTVQAQAIAFKPETPLDGALTMSLVFHLPRPKSLPKRVVHHVKRPDADNLCKSLKDALRGIIYRDDSQIVDLRVRKIYGEQPGVVVEIGRME